MQTGVQFAETLYAGYNLGYTYANNSQQISNIADTTYRTEGVVGSQILAILKKRDGISR